MQSIPNIITIPLWSTPWQFSTLWLYITCR